MNHDQRELAAEQREGLLTTLKARFERHPERHAGLAWAQVETRLAAHPGKLVALSEKLTGVAALP